MRLWQPVFIVGLCLCLSSNGLLPTTSLRRRNEGCPAHSSHVRTLYESDRVLAISKPEGIPHHDDNGGRGILNIMREMQRNGTLDYTGRLYGVHRLDRVTSGILLLAKDQEMASQLTKQFREGKVVKYYYGISSKKPLRKRQGWIKGGMKRGRRSSWYLTRDRENYAVTRFFTTSLSSLGDHVVSTEQLTPRTLVLFRPYTGRSHQLRVAAKSVGLPLLGDPTYSQHSLSTARTFLHATAIHVHDLEEPITVWCPPPFCNLWNKEGPAAFDGLVDSIFRRHCDCEDMLRAME